MSPNFPSKPANGGGRWLLLLVAMVVVLIVLVLILQSPDAIRFEYRRF